jgi:GTP-binding protein
MLIDFVKITVKAGDGGHGGSTLRRTAQTAKGGPDGGNGGNGGSIYAVGSSNMTDLHEFRYKKKIVAENGISGKGAKKFGRNADDIEILLPLGTHLTDLVTGQTTSIDDDTHRVLLARGGKGGRGNAELKSPTNRTPLHGEPGEKGQVRELHLDLRMIAQIGLVGLPNAGKSSLQKVLTNASPAIGAYPFTTLEPNIGMLETHSIADIPGLIEGASTGKGLGIRFLKHIEKTKILIHCIDVGSPDPLQAYAVIRDEFAHYNETLVAKPEIVLLTKTDLVDTDRVRHVQALFAAKNIETQTILIYDEKRIATLKAYIVNRLTTQ